MVKIFRAMGRANTDNTSLTIKDSKILNGKVTKSKKSGIVVLKYISSDVGEDEIFDVLDRFGKIRNVKTLTSKQRHRAKKTLAFVKYDELKDAQFAAKTLNERFRRNVPQMKAICFAQNDMNRQEYLGNIWNQLNEMMSNIKTNLGMVPNQQVGLSKSSGKVNNMETVLESFINLNWGGDTLDDWEEKFERLFDEIEQTLNFIMKKFAENPLQAAPLLKELDNLAKVLEIIVKVAETYDPEDPDFFTKLADLYKQLEYVLSELHKIEEQM